MGLKKGYRDYIYEYDSKYFDNKYPILFYANVYGFSINEKRFTPIIAIVYILIINRININIFKQR